MIGNCEMSGAKGSIPLEKPAKAGQLTVEVSLPAPIWWNGDTPEAIKDGMEYCMAAEIAWRAGYDKLEVVNVGWDPLVSGQTSGYDLTLSQVSITEDRKKAADFSDSYYDIPSAWIAKAGSFKDVNAATLKGKKIIVTRNTPRAK